MIYVRLSSGFYPIFRYNQYIQRVTEFCSLCSEVVLYKLVVICWEFPTILSSLCEAYIAIAASSRACVHLQMYEEFLTYSDDTKFSSFCNNITCRPTNEYAVNY